MKLTRCSRCQCLLKNEEDADDYDPGLLDYPCTRVVTVVNAGAIKKRSRAPGEDAGEPTPLSPRIEQSPRKSKMPRVRGKGGGEMQSTSAGNLDILEVGEVRRRQGL